jgi:hypothetical protein
LEGDAMTTPELSRILQNVHERAAMGDDAFVGRFRRSASNFIAGWERHGRVLAAAERVHLAGRPRARIAFSTMKFGELAAATSRFERTVVLATGADDLRRSASSRIRFLPLLTARSMIEREVLSACDGLAVRWEIVDQAVSLLTEAMRAARVEHLVVWNDVTVVERAMVAAARRCGVTSHVLQHGLYMSGDGDPRIVGGADADRSLVWGDHFAEFFVQSRIVNRDAIAVSGYPYRIEPLRVCPIAADVCIVGQDWEGISADAGEGKLEFIARTLAACQRAGMSASYRLHPSERAAHVTDRFPQIRIASARQTLREAFEAHPIFVSLNSTVLVEAGLVGRTAVQFRSSAFDHDDFQVLGGAYSVTTEHELADLLAGSKSGSVAPLPIDRRYIDVPGELGRGLLDAIASLKTPMGACSGPVPERRPQAVNGPTRRRA